jgi:hypothetical protein
MAFQYKWQMQFEPSRRRLNQATDDVMAAGYTEFFTQRNL